MFPKLNGPSAPSRSAINPPSVASLSAITPSCLSSSSSPRPSLGSTCSYANGISTTMSPRTIITGTTANYSTHCRVPIGAYCEVHNESNPSNTETPCTSYNIALNPTGNLQGSYRFLSLDTGKRILRRCWTELSITNAVIARVHACPCQTNI